MEFDFARYIEDFNVNDDSSFVQKYFTTDIVIEGPDRIIRGRDEWLNTLRFVHTGVKEELHTIMVVREGDKLMAEEDAVFTPSIDRPDFPFAQLKAGVPVTVRFFASYRLRGSQVAKLNLAFWMPGARVM